MLTTLCPPCQVRQRRFSGDIWQKRVRYDLDRFYDSPEYDPDTCDAGFVEECSCPACLYERNRMVYVKILEEEEKALYQKMLVLASLPIYQGK